VKETETFTTTTREWLLDRAATPLGETAGFVAIAVRHADRFSAREN